MGGRKIGGGIVRSRILNRKFKNRKTHQSHNKSSRKKDDRDGLNTKNSFKKSVNHRKAQTRPLRKQRPQFHKSAYRVKPRIIWSICYSRKHGIYKRVAIHKEDLSKLPTSKSSEIISEEKEGQFLRCLEIIYYQRED